MTKYMSIILLLIVLSWCHVISQSQDIPIQAEAPWSWYIAPVPAKIGNCLAEDTVVLMMRVQEMKDIHVVIVSFAKLTDIFELRAVAFDKMGKRFQFSSAGGGSSGGIYIRNYRLAAGNISVDEITYIGIEQLTEEAHYSVIVPRAAAALKKDGVEILPTPNIGKSYDFEMTTLKGSKVSSKMLLGKVVLLDFWATWCQPCMKMLPDLKKTYIDFRDRGFEVIGVNLDQTIEIAREATVKEDLQWPNVVAPTNETHRDLWEIVAGMQGIPRLLILDRNGTLRADTSPSEFRREIERVLDE